MTADNTCPLVLAYEEMSLGSAVPDFKPLAQVYAMKLPEDELRRTLRTAKRKAPTQSKVPKNAARSKKNCAVALMRGPGWKPIDTNPGAASKEVRRRDG